MSTRGTLWHPQTHMPIAHHRRLVIVSGDGAWVTTEDGRRLLDLPAGLRYANVGHGRARIAEAAAAAVIDRLGADAIAAIVAEPAIEFAAKAGP